MKEGDKHVFIILGGRLLIKVSSKEEKCSVQVFVVECV